MDFMGSYSGFCICLPVVWCLPLPHDLDYLSGIFSINFFAKGFC